MSENSLAVVFTHQQDSKQEFLIKIMSHIVHCYYYYYYYYYNYYYY